jgi:hypothetical protein
MEDNALANSSFSATINAPIEKVHIASWHFTRPESEYQSAHQLTAPPQQRRRLTDGACRSMSKYWVEA